MNCRKALMWPSGILGSMLSSRLGNAVVLGVALARCEVGGSVGSWAAAEQICPQPAGQGIIAIRPAQHIDAVLSAQYIIVVATIECVVAVGATQRVGPRSTA